MSKKVINFYQNNGFTFVELLVVIAIIGIILGLSIFGLQSAKESARDGKRKSDLESIKSALELYRADKNEYPETADIETEIVSDYISSLPTDPIPTQSYGYTAVCDTSDIVCTNSVNCTGAGCCAYQLEATLEDGTTHTVCNP